MAGFVVAQTTTSSSTSASSSGSSSSSDNTNFDVTNIDRTRRSKHIERLWIFKLHADHDEQLHGARTKPPIVPFCVAGKLQPPLPSDRMDDKNTTVGAMIMCTCQNGTAPALASYANTYVSDQCQERFAACRIQNPGSDACITCGTLKATDVPASTSSAAATSTAAATSSAEGSTTSPTGANSSGPPSSGGNILVNAEMGVKGLAALLAAMGLML
ncbi:MAG: hypothetical protein LQ346_003420 [Caloplaca aetnensis]|nr:MAG: hypothetical protein LQ346_003420 [Caloplaca aetnensis]